MASKKQSAKDRMNAAEVWVNDYQPKKFNTGNFHKNLESGIALGYVALGIDANLAKKHFKQKDLTNPKIGPFPNRVRISGFINFCKAYGCDERDIFRTVYLSDPKDDKDLGHVVRTLENLSSLIESKGGNQSRVIGISGRKKLVTNNDANYKKAQSQSVDSYGIVKHPNVAKSSWNAKQFDAAMKSKKAFNTNKAASKWNNKSNTNTNSNEASWKKTVSAPKQSTNSSSVSSALWGNNNNNSNNNDKPKPPPAPVKKWSNNNNNNNVSKPPPVPKQAPKSNDDYKSNNNNQLSGTDNPNKNKSFGFSAEQQQKQAGKYNANMEKQVVAWINKCVGPSFKAEGGGPANLQSSLKNGVVLCKLVNTIKPGSIKPKIVSAGVGKKGAMAAFNDKQRINEFSRCAKQMGLMAASSFEADDLWEGKNMTAVLVGLYGFGVLCAQKKFAAAKGGIKGTGKNENRGGSLYG